MNTNRKSSGLSSGIVRLLADKPMQFNWANLYPRTSDDSQEESDVQYSRNYVSTIEEQYESGTGALPTMSRFTSATSDHFNKVQ